MFMHTIRYSLRQDLAIPPQNLFAGQLLFTFVIQKNAFGLLQKNVIWHLKQRILCCKIILIKTF